MRQHGEFYPERRRHWYWEDMRMAAAADKLFSPAGRITFDYANGGLAYAAAATYAGDFAIFTTQMSHKFAEGSPLVEIHVHWDQNQNQTPNIVVERRFTNIGSAFTLPFGGPTALNNNIAAWVAGGIHQVTNGAAIVSSSLGISHMVEIKLYRDSANASGLFAGADPYVGAWLVKEVDIHYQADSPGSWTEYSKW